MCGLLFSSFRGSLECSPARDRPAVSISYTESAFLSLISDICRLPIHIPSPHIWLLCYRLCMCACMKQCSAVYPLNTASKQLNVALPSGEA